jgi:hypothetical protein
MTSQKPGAGVVSARRRPLRWIVTFLLGLLALITGALVGTASAPDSFTHAGRFDCDFDIPDGTTVSDVVSFQENRLPSRFSSSRTVTLPTSSYIAQVLAGLHAEPGDQSRYVWCLFRVPTRPTIKAAADGSTMSFTTSDEYSVVGGAVRSRPARGGLELIIPTGTDTNDAGGPVDTRFEFTVHAGGRDVEYSQPPQHRDDDSLTWSWTSSTRQAKSDATELSVVVPLGAEERIAAALWQGGGRSWSWHAEVGQLSVFISLGLSYPLGWLSGFAAVLTMLLLGRRLGGLGLSRWGWLAAAVLVLALPMLVIPSVILVIPSAVGDVWGSPTAERYQEGHEVRIPASGILSLLCLLLALAWLRRANLAKEPGLDGGIPAWLPIASAPMVGAAAVAGLRQRASWAEGRLATFCDVMLVSLVIWASTALVIVLVRATLSAVPARPLQSAGMPGKGGDNGERTVTGLERQTVPLYRRAVVAVSISGAIAAAYALSGVVGQAWAEFRFPNSQWPGSLARLADRVGDLSIYPAAYLVLPLTAALAAARVTRYATAHTLTRRAVALAALAWAVTSRAPDLEAFGTALPIGAWLVAALVAAGAVVSLPGSGSDGAPGEESADFRLRREAWLAGAPLVQPTADVLRAGPGLNAGDRVNIAVRWSVLLAVLPVGYLLWGSLTTIPGDGSQSSQAPFVISQVVNEVLRWTLTGCLYALLLPWLPGRVGPVKALWLAGAWFAAALPVAVINGWTGNTTGREWLFPGLQLVLFLTVLGVLVDASTLYGRADAGRPATPRATWAALLQAYNVDGIRPVLLYAAPAALAIIGIGQQVVSGTALEFVTSLLSATSPVIGGR